MGAISRDAMTITMVSERGTVAHSSTIKPLVNTPEVLDSVYRAEKYAADKATAWYKADEKAKQARAAADKATTEKEEAEKISQEREEIEKEANAEVDAAKKNAEAAASVQEDAEAKAVAKKDLLKVKEAEGADPQELERLAAEKAAADAFAVGKKKAAGKAHYDMIQAAKTAGYRESSETRALEAATGAEAYAQKALVEKDVAAQEAAAKKAALKT